MREVALDLCGWFCRRVRIKDLEMSSFPGLVSGMICRAETIASASGVLNSVGVITHQAAQESAPLG